jgi:hypothetical protein
MKRDWDCIRAILVALEDKGDPSDQMSASAVPDFDATTVSYHMKLMIEARLIDGTCNKGGTLHCSAKAMTWEGHELLDKIRSEKVWNRIKTLAREQGIALSFQAVKILGTHALEHLLPSIT